MGSFHGLSCPTFLWLRAVFLGLQHGSLASDVSSSSGHCVSPVGTAGDRGKQGGLGCRWGNCSRMGLPAVPLWLQWRGGGAVWGQVLTTSCLGYAFQVAQTSRALHWIMTALRDSGFGSEEGVPTLGEWGATPAAGLYWPVFF